MQIDFQVRYTVEESGEVLCFKHAVKAAINNVDIFVQFDDFNDEHFMGSTICVECERLRKFGLKKPTDSVGSM